VIRGLLGKVTVNGQTFESVMPLFGLSDESITNAYAVRALQGYAWEWVGDFNNSMVTGESRADSGLNCSLYCTAGALGTADPDNYVAFMRYVFRSSLKGDNVVSNIGFRGARSIEPD
jgi:sulfatase modifying factor 1